MQILLVDDNPLMQQVINSFLVSHGYSVAIAATGQDALAVISDEVCRLLMIDMRLPDQDGPDLLVILRQLPGMAHCPAIAVSGLGEEDRERTVAAGFDMFLAKPIDLDELLATVQRYVGQQPSHTNGTQDCIR